MAFISCRGRLTQVLAGAATADESQCWLNHRDLSTLAMSTDMSQIGVTLFTILSLFIAIQQQTGLHSPLEVY